MRLKSVYLALPIKPPWSTNFVDFLDPPKSFTMTATPSWVEIAHGTDNVLMLVPLSLVRSALVLKAEPLRVYEEPTPDCPLDAAAPPATKRRGRQPAPVL